MGLDFKKAGGGDGGNARGHDYQIEKFLQSSLPLVGRVRVGVAPMSDFSLLMKKTVCHLSDSHPGPPHMGEGEVSAITLSNQMS